MSLYRKYRPKTFEEVIAQPHITKTLQNQLASGSVNHAYLFCGTRGSGKTSTAKIFANQLAKDLDIFEIDAASNNSVDDIRDIIEKTKYPPTFSKYKVYIIDEVHMFSGSAFNAFLKTLEDPPKYIIFILCTTEPHKLPATIQSRVLRFDFRPIPEKELEKHLTEILNKEKIKFEPDAIKQIAISAQGSVRDSLSLLEAVVAYDKNITLVNVETVTGTVSRKELETLVDVIIAKKDVKPHLCKIFEKTVNLNLVIRDLMRVVLDKRALTLYKTFAELEMFIKTALDQKTLFEGACLYLSQSV